MEKKRQVQEELYRFPYHYLIEFEADGYSSFCQYKNNSGGWRYASYLIKAIEEIEHIEFDNMIDIGCGDGFFLKKLSQKYPSKELAGVDLCEKAIGFANLLNCSDDKTTKKIEFFCRDIMKDPLEKKFDLATSIHVLEHIPPELLKDFLEANANLLKSDGRFIVMVPSTNCPIKNISRHYQHFDDKLLTKLLSKCFEVETIKYLNNDCFWVKIISRIFSNNLFILNNRYFREGLFKFYMRCFIHGSRSNAFTLMAVCRKL